MEQLIVTEIGTIKAQGFQANFRRMFGINEITLQKFLNKINKKLKTNKSETMLCYIENYKFKYDAQVQKENNNSEDIYDITIDGKEFCLDISNAGTYYPILKKKLEEYCEITNINNKIEKNANMAENSNLSDIASKEEILMCLDYLKKKKRNLKKEKIKFILSCIVVVLGPASSILFLNSGVMLYLITSLVSFISLLKIANMITDNVIKSLFSISKMTNYKIKALEKKLQQMIDTNIKINSYSELNTKKTDIYKDNIIKYMKNIMISANKLKGLERKHILMELSEILDDYTIKTKNINEKSSNNLSLIDNERAIATSTIDKLVSLEMEVAELLKRDKRNENISQQSIHLKEEIDKNIDLAEKENSEGKKLLLKTH